MENINGGKLNCEVCEAKAYDTTDKTNDGEISLVCFACKDARLTERNTGLDFEGDFEGEDSVAMSVPQNPENDSEYITEMADRFGVGGRY